MFLSMQLQTALALPLGEPDTAFDIHKTTYGNAPVRLSDKLEFDGEKHHVSHFIRFLKTAYLFLFIGSLILNATSDGTPVR